MSDTSVAVPIADERTRRIFGDLVFSSAKRGFDTAEVTAFLVNASGAVERMLNKLREAEGRAATAEGRAATAEAREAEARHQLSVAPPPPAPVEDNSGLLERTLALAEKTAIAAVSDARARSQAILTQAQEQAREYFAKERQAIADEWDRVRAESSQLETLRLAVAAETMALDGVRSHLRTRIAGAADELARIAQNPDLLSYAIAQHRVEIDPTDLAPPVAAVDQGVTAGGTPAEVIDASSVSSLEKSFKAKWASEPYDHQSDEAFDRFFSDDVEPEPTQQWILAG